MVGKDFWSTRGGLLQQGLEPRDMCVTLEILGLGFYQLK